jgi:hypothetical protein
MLCSVNCDDYFEWHGFFRHPSDGEKDSSLGQQQLISCPPRLQRHENAAGKISSKRQKDRIISRKSRLDAKTDGYNDILASEEMRSAEDHLRSVQNYKSKDETNLKRLDCGSIIDLYSDPVDNTCSRDGDDYCCVQPSSIASTRVRRPLSERSNLPPPLPLGRCSRTAAPPTKLRSVSLSPLRTSKPIGLNRENFGKYFTVY